MVVQMGGMRLPRDGRPRPHPDSRREVYEYRIRQYAESKALIVVQVDRRLAEFWDARTIAEVKAAVDNSWPEGVGWYVEGANLVRS